MHNNAASITRDLRTKAATLDVTAAGPWTLFAGPAPESIDFSRPIATGTDPGTIPLPETASGWTCFAFVAGENAPLYLAERHLPMAGGYNFRDLGGFAGAGGRRVAWGKFLRTDGLNTLTDRDLDYLSTIPVATVVDFRTLDEAGRTPDRIPSSTETVLHLPIAPGHMHPESTKRFSDFENPDDFMLAMYRDLALDKGIAETYRAFFARVQAEDSLPLLFHCSAGKDRTGIAAALILLTLGVDMETVLADYEASNLYLDDKYASIIREHPHLRGLLTVKRLFLEEALSLVEAEYGSVLRYLEDALAVDVSAMRGRFLL